ncbi:MAG: type I-U CRISPR-associated protein Csb2 [Eubacteriales bacterium]|nr:type I-U CRISPR-associated protein Csb2 [Eubacteriales bacterium]MDD3073488.1 type I-U CRISPR-associated protein Csb2 [Eubacteriales bacterium]MDD4078723.1 type I-U CRISPR-associated protein Csb2 [Eubacteriales bacterium]
MVALEISFLAGRYHATPWGRHVNEGISEWPPSPWRVLRMLVALWHRDLPGEEPELFISLLNKLAELPSFYLPPATQGCSQHYMPAPSKRRLVFDTFVVINRENHVYIIWPDTNLSEAEMKMLSDLLANATYLGRGESWADIKLVTQYPDPNCFPHQTGAPLDGEGVRVLATEPGPNILGNLQYDTLLKHKLRLLDPEGSRWVNYSRPSDAFAVTYQQKQRGNPKVNVVRFALHGKPLPRLQDTVVLGELARASAMAMFGRMNGGATSSVLSGKDQEGNPLLNHQHAYYLPTDEDKDGWLDHLTVYVPQGLSGSELDAVTSLRVLNSGVSQSEVGLFLLGVSDDSELNALPFGEAKVWGSITPFVLGRFPKYYRTGKPKFRDNGHQIDGPVDQVYREWNLRRALNQTLPELISVEPIASCSLRSRLISWASFRMWRRKGKGTRTPGLAYGFRLEFKNPVRGPITLGYGSHFGLGLFFPQPTSGGMLNE